MTGTRGKAQGSRRKALGLVPLTLALALWSSVATAQQLLDRVVARVNGTAITLTDVQAALGLGVIDAATGADAEKSAIDQLVERDLLLNEVERFPPPEPMPAEVDKQAALYAMHADGRLAALKESAGIDDRAIRDMARDTLRIQAYLTQRFGTAGVVTDDEAQQYYEAHPAEFTRNGRRQPFDAVETEARAAAAAERRRTTITQWLRDLRGRADVVDVARK
jgi:hypothetical protein